ncbi:MAG TPA: hypothetical protein VLJ59_03805 [Mycobacteriales bacterium]|nr:hypothetical protein [Mycobacteriales bacterium]
MASTDNVRAPGGQVLGRLVQDLVADERASKASVESRAAGLITAAGSLVTVLFAIAAFVTSRVGYVLPVPARWLLVGALTSLLAASVAAIVVNLPAGQHEIRADDLLGRIHRDEDWNAREDDVELALAKALAGQLVRARQVNRAKARLLAYAIFGEVSGIAFIGAAVSVILATPVH